MRFRPLFILLLFTLLILLLIAADVYVFSRRDDRRRADAAIVLGAGVYGRRPSPVLRERINHALLLYERGFVEAVVFTGGSARAGDPPESAIAAAYAESQGLPAAAILTETTSTNTKENLANARDVAASHGLDTFLIVSTPFHMRRSLALAHDLGMEASSSPTRTIQWISWYTKSRAYAREVVAYLHYLLSGTGDVP
jgi:uncharacterized SAM-binding protein YcdF (DUF218 family)